MFLNRLLIFFVAILFSKPFLFAQEEKIGKLEVIVLINGQLSGGQNAIMIDDQKFILASSEQILAVPTGDHTLKIALPRGGNFFTQITIEELGITKLVVNYEIEADDVSVDIETPSQEFIDDLVNEKLLQLSQEAQYEFTGTIVEEISGKPVKDARIFVQGSPVNTVSDSEGQFTLSLVPGDYTITIMHAQYATLTLNNTIVSDDTSKNHNHFKMSPRGIQLVDYVVTSPRVVGSSAALLLQRRNVSSVTDVLSSEQMSKSGSGDVGGALRRVTGLTLVGGKYVYVRGLGERYSSTLLNGTTLPSPEPTRKVIPMDLIPVNILESVNIQKSYIPEMPGEFGGGTIELKTKSIPDDFILSASLSTSYVTGDTLHSGIAYKRGKKDWLGFDDGTRAMPKELKEAGKNGRRIGEQNDAFAEGLSPEELQAVGRAMPNIYNTKSRKIPLGLGLSVAYGDRFYLDNSLKFGILTSLYFGNEVDKIEKQKKNYDIGSVETKEMALGRNILYDGTDEKIKLGGLITVGTEIGKHSELSLSELLIRKTGNLTQEAMIYNIADNKTIRRTNLKWHEDMLNIQQLVGKHRILGTSIPSLSLSPLFFEWQLTQAIAKRYTPDSREYSYNLDATDNQFVYGGRNIDYQRTYSLVEDTSHEAKIKMTLPFTHNQKNDIKFSLGASRLWKNRSSGIRRFYFADKRVQKDPLLTRKTLEEILAPENIKDQGFVLTEITRATDTYKAEQSLTGVFFQSDVWFNSYFNMLLGARREFSLQSVQTYELYNPDNKLAEANLVTSHLLPVVATTFKLTVDDQIRLSFSKTIARPDFRELSTASYFDDENDIEISGNQDLRTTSIDNWDLRWESYFNSLENISFGLFYKRFIDPIEANPGPNDTMSYANALGAKNYGFEMEGKADLGNRFTLGGNFSLIKSNIILSEEQNLTITNTKRPLQGQSPFVVNIEISHEPVNKKYISTTLLYNICGKRIYAVGTGAADDIYEMPQHQLDLILSKKISDSLSVKFSAKNLLSQNSVLKQSSETLQVITQNREYSLGVSGSL